MRLRPGLIAIALCLCSVPLSIGGYREEAATCIVGAMVILALTDDSEAQ